MVVGGEKSKYLVPPGGGGGGGSTEELTVTLGLQRQVEVAGGLWKDSVWCVWETAQPQALEFRVLGEKELSRLGRGFVARL